jgi:hypothetical protein
LNIPSVLADKLAGFQMWTVETDLAIEKWSQQNLASKPFKTFKLFRWSEERVSRSKDVMRGDCVLAWMFSSPVLVVPIMLSP